MIGLPKLILTDIDGVWTDGGMYYDNLGNELKKFHTYDSAGVMFARALDIEVGIITGENTEIVARRAGKLNISLLRQGVRNKYQVIQEILDERSLGWEDLAYIGDDLNDIQAIQAAGLSASPSNAPKYISEMATWQLETRGGDGAFREFVERIIKESGHWNTLMSKIIEGTIV